MVHKKTAQYTFVLSGINVNELIKLYYHEEEKETAEDVTQIVQDVKKEAFYHFYDFQKNKISFLLTMIDNLNTRVLPEKTTKPCWWCGYEFENSPIGLPIRYHTSYKNNPYISEYEKYMKSIGHSGEGKFEFFETEGIFCSFPCCKAMILSDPSYKKSITLLNLMYSKCNEDCKPSTENKIKKAGSWKLLEKWGGPLTITEYRKSFDNIEYFETSNVRKPFMFTSHFYFEEIPK